MTRFRKLLEYLHYIVTTWATLRFNWLVSLAHNFVVLLFFLSLATIAWRWQYLPPQVPLWYAKPWGEEQLAHPLWLFLLPGATLVFYLINVLISVLMATQHLLFIQLLFANSLLVALLSFFTLTKILFLVT